MAESQNCFRDVSEMQEVRVAERQIASETQEGSDGKSELSQNRLRYVSETQEV